MGLAAAARPASGGNVLRKAEKVSGALAQAVDSARILALCCLGWGLTPVEDWNKLLITSTLSLFICKMEIALVPTRPPGC